MNKMNKMKDMLTDIIHTAAQAALTDDEQAARQGLADIYDAIASVLPVDHPPKMSTDFTDSHGFNPCKSVKSVDEAELHEAATEEPAVSGCPSLGPKVLPSGFDGVEPADHGLHGLARIKSEKSEEKKNPFYEFYGLKLNRFGGAGLNSKLIGKRVNVDQTVQVFEIDVKRGNLATGARAFVTENGEMLFSLVGGKSFAAVEQMAVSALHGLLKRRHDSNLRRKARRAAKRAAAKEQA